MIFWMFVILFVFSIMLMIIGKFIYGRCGNMNVCNFCELINELVGPLILTVSLFVVVIMLIAIIITRLSVDGCRAKNEVRYEALIYKSHTESVRDQFGILNKAYIDEVQSWNEDLAGYRSCSENFWIGIFFPDRAVDGFEFINLENVNPSSR